MQDLNLRDYILQILKYKKLISLIILVTFIASFIFNFFVAKPFYESSASILVAQFASSGIFTQSATKDQIESEFFIQRLAEMANESPGVIRKNLTVRIPPGSNNTINISFKSYSPKKCVDVLNKMLNLLKETNKEEYTRRISKIESSLYEAKVRLPELQNTKNVLESKIKDLESSQLIEKDKMIDFSILLGTYSSILQQIADTNYTIKDNETVLMNSNDFKFFVEPSTPTKAGPNRILNIILTVIIIFLVSLFIVLLKEYISPDSHSNKA
jgi:capsular polysaccharide biosynthesis protein